LELNSTPVLSASRGISYEIMSDIRLICLDFDGTILVYDEKPGFFHPAAIDMLNGLVERGIVWCTNSGRDAEGQMKILELSRARGLRHMPAVLLCSESFIFERRDGTYAPSEPWNSAARKMLRRFHRVIQQAVRPNLDDWIARYRPEVYIAEEYTTFNVVDADGQPLRFHGEIETAIRGIPDAVVSRNGGWISIMPSELGKGNTLRAYLRLAGLQSGHALAIGDHLNDINMLNGTVARHVACPADAMAEVVDAVTDAGGYVARAAGPEGTVEAVRHFLRM
jgi:hydroxymethylpyrimidine pyrophosphatase-like HAD family hydrolase